MKDNGIHESPTLSVIKYLNGAYEEIIWPVQSLWRNNIMAEQVMWFPASINGSVTEFSWTIEWSLLRILLFVTQLFKLSTYIILLVFLFLLPSNFSIKLFIHRLYVTKISFDLFLWLWWPCYLLRSAAVSTSIFVFFSVEDILNILTYF